MLSRKLPRVYTRIWVLAFLVLALLVSNSCPAGAKLSFPGNPGDPQGSHVTSANFPTNPG